MIKFVFYKTDRSGKMFSFNKEFANRVAAEMWARNTNHILMGTLKDEQDVSQSTREAFNLDN